MEAPKITDIPEEVITHHLLPLLQPNDVVRLRRVCKKMKSFADDHLRLHVRTNRILTICERSDNGDANERQRSDRGLMKDLLSLNCHLPVSRLSFCFKNEENIFEDDNWQMQDFLKQYGKQITHLTMSTISMPMNNPKEIAFYEGLPNLTHLTIVEVQPGEETWEKEGQEEYHFPTTFKILKHLDVQCVKINSRNSVAVRKYFWTLVGFCANLETLLYPGFRNSTKTENHVSILFHYLSNLLQSGRLANLKYYDLKKVSSNGVSSIGGPFVFANFCKVCNQYNVKLHINACFLDNLNGIELLEQVGRSVASLKVLDISCINATFPNLDYLDIYAFNLLRTDRPDIAVPVWPNLKRLRFSYYTNNPDRLSRTVYFLFEAIRRPSVKSLELWCPYPANTSSAEQATSDVNRLSPTLMLGNIASSCFNLRTVTIFRWGGTDEDMSLFWSKLPLLEEICLTKCKDLSDAAFIGEDVNKPVFLELKSLRKMSLCEIHQMPKITDVLFKLVICHLQLREFYLTSWDPENSNNLRAIDAITPEGIKSLLTSDFAKTIERFPFDSWKLRDMNETEFFQLGKQFRSSQML